MARKRPLLKSVLIASMYIIGGLILLFGIASKLLHFFKYHIK